MKHLCLAHAIENWCWFIWLQFKYDWIVNSTIAPQICTRELFVGCVDCKRNENEEEKKKNVEKIHSTYTTIKLIKSPTIIAFYLQLTTLKRVIQLKNLINDSAKCFPSKYIKKKETITIYRKKHSTSIEMEENKNGSDCLSSSGNGGKIIISRTRCLDLLNFEWV